MLERETQANFRDKCIPEEHRGPHISHTNHSISNSTAVCVHVDPSDSVATIRARSRSTQTSCTLVRRKEWVNIDVGGVSFKTTLSTLCSEPDSVLAAMVRAELRGNLSVEKDNDMAILLDLDPTFFGPVLNYLRHGKLVIPPDVPAPGVLAVAEYLNIKGIIEKLTPKRHTLRQFLYSWGSGTSGELGTQCLQDRDTPTLVQITPFGVRVADVSLGASYSCALSEDGNVYTFGNGDWGQLGLSNPRNTVELSGDTVVATVPKRIPLFERQPAVHIAAGYAYAMALTADHHVYFWGNNNHGQSGLGPLSFGCELRIVEEPTLVTTLEGKRIVQLSCGSFFTLALSNDGTLYSWGLLECLGLGSADEVRSMVRDSAIMGESLSAERRTVVLEPQVVRVPTQHKLVRINAGQWHSGAISVAGELFTWGVGFQWRLGHGSNEPGLRPQRVLGALVGEHVVDVACGSFHTVALTDKGKVYCWGDNASRQCGANAIVDVVKAPYHVANLEFIASGIVKAISCGRQHTVVVVEGPHSDCQCTCCKLGPDGQPGGQHGRVYAFGDVAGLALASWGVSGQKGSSLTGDSGGFADRRIHCLPCFVPMPNDMNVKSVKSGLHHTFVFAEELSAA
ncbi:BTB POZ domain [Trypanosoma vivax]|uniref:BTB domain-containing protein n=1 Tax=Trypanosoma vivax (strain Y486) TaxID=1055687 RepID=G0TZA2_TRYVY|nr:BTB POZ domain [Trypanosoma vivax]CCC49305.1 conserved hypothetical protein [Trypanosoma vivax Y486]